MQRTYRRKRYARKNYARKRKPSKAFTRKVLKVVRKVQEKKYWPFLNSTTISLVGSLLDVSGVTQGDTDVTRDGDQLTVKSMIINFSNTVADGSNYLRFIAFQWYPATTPTSADVILDTTQPIISPYAHDTRYQYRILQDKLCYVDTDDPNRLCMMKVTRGFKTRTIQYIGGGTTGTNKIYVFVFSDSGAAPHPAVAWSGKLNFVDS